MANVAVDIKDLLVAEGVGTFGTDLWIGREPAAGGEAVTIYPSGGQNPNPKWGRDFPTVKIKISGDVNDYAGGWTKAQEVKDALLGATPQDINGNRYASFRMQGDINFIGYDSNSRPMFTTNWILIVDLNTGLGNRSTF